MVQYTLSSYTSGILNQELPNLSLQEAYMIAKPLVMDRWHLMMYDAVVERLSALPAGANLLVAWEEELDTMPCEYRYIRQEDPSQQ
uniref:Uncharacterized protein n=1 Tax=viral metagenome TaxID=1070528 RepID=A0A6C0JVW7_9ZZZZ